MSELKSCPFCGGDIMKLETGLLSLIAGLFLLLIIALLIAELREKPATELLQWHGRQVSVGGVPRIIVRFDNTAAISCNWDRAHTQRKQVI